MFFGISQNIWIILAILWTIPWKGVSLWRAARNNQTGWFVALMVINTLGILEIIYLFFFQADKSSPCLQGLDKNPAG